MPPSDDHPLFYHSGRPLPIIDHARGIRMWDTTGKEYIDGCSCSVLCNIGHGDERVLQAMAAQASRVSFSYRTQFDNQPSLELARQLVSLTPEHLTRVFYVSGGSEAVETAMKLCRQYFFVTGQPARSRFVSRATSYHGATLGALALTSYAPLEDPFQPLKQDYPKIPAPYCYRCPYGLTHPDCGLECALALEKVLLEQGPETVAAFVVEPVTGSSVGALPPPTGYFEIIQKTCRDYGVMLILDEVMTGFGRTGALFAFEHWSIEADIVAMSKGMGSGYYPLGGVLTTSRIADSVLAHGGFAHGHSYAGNPMACAAGRAVLDIIVRDGLVQNASSMGQALMDGLEELSLGHPMIGQVRGKGLLLAVELVADTTTRKPFPPELRAGKLLTRTAYDLGLLVYPNRPINGLQGDHVVLAPPLIVTQGDVQEILDRFHAAITALEEELQAEGGTFDTAQ